MASSKLKRFLGAVGILLFPLGVITIALTVYERVRTGHGTDAFLNGYGQYETWASYAGFLIAAPVILLGMYLLRRWQLWKRSRVQGMPPKEILEHLKRDP